MQRGLLIQILFLIIALFCVAIPDSPPGILRKRIFINRSYRPKDPFAIREAQLYNEGHQIHKFR